MPSRAVTSWEFRAKAVGHHLSTVGNVETTFIPILALLGVARTVTAGGEGGEGGEGGKARSGEWVYPDMELLVHVWYGSYECSWTRRVLSSVHSISSRPRELGQLDQDVLHLRHP